MLSYKGYLYISNPTSLALVTVEKNKGEVLVIDTFPIDTTDFINENGVIIFPLAFAEEVAGRFNTERYNIKELTLVISPRDAEFKVSIDNHIDNSKALAEYGKGKLEAQKKPSEAFELGWISPGSILDEGPNPYTVMAQYHYPKRHITNLTKAFRACGVNIVSVLLAEMALAALFEQYKSEFSDPDYLILETGYLNNPNSLTTGFWYKRNILNNITSYKTGIMTVIKTLESFYKDLTEAEIREMLFSCGAFREYQTEEAKDILEMRGINADEWYAVCTREFHAYMLTLSNDINGKKAEKIDEIILTGEICLIPGLEKVFREKYKLPVRCWENEYELALDKKTLICPTEEKHSPEYAILFGAIYFNKWVKNLGHSSLTRKEYFINSDKYFRTAIYGLVAAILVAFINLGPTAYDIYSTEKQIETLQENQAMLSQLQSEIATYESKIDSKRAFLERAKASNFNLKDFMFNIVLLKPKDITIISVDSENYLTGDMQPYQYIKAAVEGLRKAAETGEEYDPYDYDASGKDWTYGLAWDGVELTPKGITGYLGENGIENVAEYVVNKIVLRGYGSTSSITRYVKDLGNVPNVFRVDPVAVEERTIPSGTGPTQKANVFELNIWIGDEAANDE